MDIRNISVDEIVEYKNNPRRVTENAIDTVVASIREFGFKVPIILDEDKVIVAGHTRLLAAKKMGLHEVPCIVADDLTPEQIRAFRLADNKVSEFSHWDFAKLEEELECLFDIDIDMSQFGFELEMPSQSDVMGSEEFDTEEFSDRKFKHECPKCGFKF